MERRNYIRDLRPAEWGRTVILRSNNPHDRMQTFSNDRRMSALPPKADIDQLGSDVRYVLKVDVLLRQCRLAQRCVEVVERPIYFVACDHQRGTDSDGVVVGVLT